VRYGVRDTGCGIRGAGYGVRDTGRDMRSGVRGAGWDVGYGLWDG